MCAEAGGEGAWLRRTADVLARVEGDIEIEIDIGIGIGIEIENLHNDPILGKYGERLGNLQPATFNQKLFLFADQIRV